MGKRGGKSRERRNDDHDQKRPKLNGEGEYPPPHTLESAAFESYYKESGVVPADEWDAFIARLREPLGVSFRITGHHDDPGAASLRAYMEKTHMSKLKDLVLDEQPVPPPYPIEWFPGRMAWRFDVSRSTLRGKGALKNDESPAAKHLAAFHNFLMVETEIGAISRQEEVSMVPPCLLDVQPGHIVADLCAAPGSKTQQLIEAINPPRPLVPIEDDGNEAGPSGVVIANDMDYKRCHLLVHQAKRLNSPALIVTNHDATMIPTRFTGSLAGIGGSGHGGSGSVASDQGNSEAGGGVAATKGTSSLRFDRILCDVPCSGDGTLRKAPDLWRRWSDGLGLGIHRMQLHILQRALQMLKPGGRLVYSTCSMNPIEDEAVVASALKELGTSAFMLVDVSSMLPDLKRNKGMEKWRVRAEGTWYDTYDSVPSKVVTSRKLLPTMFAPSAEEVLGMHLDRCLRVLPHLQDTGGFFIAVFQRSETAPIKEPEERESRETDRRLKEGKAGSTEVRPGDWICAQCGFNVFAHKDACFKCGASRPAGAVEAGGGGGTSSSAGGAPTWQPELRAVDDGDDDEPKQETEAKAKADAEPLDCGPIEGATGDDGGAASEAGGTCSTADAATSSGVATPSSSQLVSHIPSQRNQQPGPHVLKALHCGPRNNGKYDAMYTLTPEWHEQLSEFIGLSNSFPSDQLVTRSVTGKGIYFIGKSVLRLLSNDTHSKLKLVNTGTRVLERAENNKPGHDPNNAFPFRLMQEGVHCLVPYMTKQRLFLSTSDILDLLRRRVMPSSAFKSLAFRQQLLEAKPGAIAIVHDVHNTGELVMGEPLPLVLAATRTATSMPMVELVIKQAEALSLYNRAAHNRKPEAGAGESGAMQEA